MKIAHLSDLHLLSLEGAVPMRLFNKRMTGYMNLRFHRKSVHKPFAVEAAAAEIRKLGVDHVVITGDVTNLALEVEFELVKKLVEEDLGLTPDQISMVPGNHDTYTRGSFRGKRFFRYFEPYLATDLPEIPGPFPFVRLRGPVALIGLSTAVPRLPLVAAGALRPKQLGALSRVLSHPEVRSRTPILLQHHPWHNPPRLAKTLLEGLYDAKEEAALLDGVERGLLLHGHLHRRIHRTLPTARGHIDAVGATSASLLHESDERMAGFNLYEIDDASGAIRAITSCKLDPVTKTFSEVPIPKG
ncbi:metallophosphoesterase family protein [Polyangium sorediatum]|uniref:Metallophosphoesterase n=1 Tax=Polyangium sorediatum TaxID=889274 RepID=A0ABT6P162_9BACT|nr:metallophosphoesterase [Polyangium sorediatum]MDI1434332.1 metallophosphoesterase [Polyangium sorediatum]